jgi:hypothetical protein
VEGKIERLAGAGEVLVELLADGVEGRIARRLRVRVKPMLGGVERTQPAVFAVRPGWGGVRCA